MSISVVQETGTSSAQDVSKKFGVEYFSPGKSAITGSRENDLYTYATYIGPHSVNVEKGDCIYYYDNKGVAHVQSGPAKIQSTVIATVIRGYTPPSRSVVVGRSTHLPYINGCSTRQIFTPERIGDPTLQLLSLIHI